MTQNAKQMHLPVLADEVIQGLAIQKDGYYVDATFGRGGHSALILQQLGPEWPIVSHRSGSRGY